jgi:hypothetical protein
MALQPILQRFDKRSWLHEQSQQATGRPQGERAKAGGVEARFGARLENEANSDISNSSHDTQNIDQKSRKVMSKFTLRGVALGVTWQNFRPGTRSELSSV